MTEKRFRLTGGFVWWLVMTTMRLMLGAWMLVNGLNHWLRIFATAGQHTGRQRVACDTYRDRTVRCGQSCRGGGWSPSDPGRFVPLGLVMLMPISVVIYYTDAFLQHRWNRVIYMGNDCMYFNVLLLLGYVRYYLPMLRYKAEVGPPSDLKRIGAAIRDASSLD